SLSGYVRLAFLTFYDLWSAMSRASRGRFLFLGTGPSALFESFSGNCCFIFDIKSLSGKPSTQNLIAQP
ncbi:MAG: hypothetical protein LBE27_08315, partial [Deltaproteobacteria bacterium]|nr:hypothetical protein [Deltaproteobacteria bacterium]